MISIADCIHSLEPNACLDQWETSSGGDKKKKTSVRNRPKQPQLIFFWFLFAMNCHAHCILFIKGDWLTLLTLVSFFIRASDLYSASEYIVSITASSFSCALSACLISLLLVVKRDEKLRREVKMFFFWYVFFGNLQQTIFNSLWGKFNWEIGLSLIESLSCCIGSYALQARHANGDAKARLSFSNWHWLTAVSSWFSRES